MNPSAGKGSGRLHARQQVSDKQMQDNWDKAFGKKVKCPECDSTDVHSVWVEPEHGLPEYEWCECYACDHDWNECAR